MAIQEVEKKAPVGTAGIDRSINNAAMGMVMDIVQAQQYQKPIPSTVRELTANAVDSQSEKEKAIKILSGEAKPEDYFIQREGELYQDSKWNPNYYDLNHLDKENNEIHLIYKEGEGTGRCDKFIIRDHGVGIGGRRLQGVLEVGFSTKRNRKDALGAFGLGAKVGLATGADYYKMVTVYNGVKYSVQIFNKKVNSLVGALNLETGKQNIPYEFKGPDGEVTGVIFGEATDEKNYTEIEVPCLKHYRSEFENAVRTQLLFFNNVKFWREHSDGHRIEIPFKADVLHNSDNLIIARDTPYSKPFVVIVNGDNAVGVCYGHIDFKELEMEDLRGAIGVKCNIRQVYDDPKTSEEVVVTPGVDVIASREAIRWTTATRDFLLKRFESAQDEAADLVQKELKEDDFLKWLVACKNITSLSGKDTAIGRLSRIVDLKNVKPKFNRHGIKYTGPKLIFEGFASVKSVTKVLDKENSTSSKRKYQGSAHEVEGWLGVDLDKTYFRVDSNVSRIKDVYLSDKHGGAFNRIDLFDEERYLEYILKRVSTYMDHNPDKFKTPESRQAYKKKQTQKMIDYRINVLNEVKSSELYKTYDDVEVPEDFQVDLEEEEMKEEAKSLTNAERRALEDRIVANTYIEKYFAYNDQFDESFKKSKVEPKIKEIDEFEGKLFYGYQVDETKLQYALHIARRTLYTTTGKYFYGDDYRFLSVSKSNKKYFRKHNHIDDFFGTQKLVKKEGKVVGLHLLMDNIVVKWNTARIMKERMGNLSFFRNFEEVDKEMTDLFNEVNNYINSHYEDTSKYSNRTAFNEHHNDFISFLTNLQTFQEIVEKDPTDSETIAEAAKQLSLPNGTTGGVAVDTEMLEKLDLVLSYAKPVRELFNHIDILTLSGNYVNHKPEVSMELGMFLKEILDMKGVKHE